jgi:hypothetical protein
MEQPISATLHIVPEVAQAYRALYTIVYDGVAATPLKLHGAEKLKAFLTQCQIPPHDIEKSMTRLQAGMSEVLDLRHLDKAQVAALLRAYAGG